MLGTLAVHELVRRLEGFTADAVEPDVRVLVDVAVVVDPLDELLDEALVLLVRRPDEEIDVGADLLRYRPPLLCDPVDVLLRVEPLGLGHAVHLGRVLVGAREEERDRKSTRLNSSHANISYAVFCLKKK